MTTAEAEYVVAHRHDYIPGFVDYARTVLESNGGLK